MAEEYHIDASYDDFQDRIDFSLWDVQRRGAYDWNLLEGRVIRSCHYDTGDQCIKLIFEEKE